MEKANKTRKLLKYLAFVQSFYYTVYGIWPVLHIKSFERLTGPKVDRWLVKSIGLLITVIGAGLGLGGWRELISPELKIIAVGSAAGLAGIDIYYAAKNRISKIYLLDAIAEIGLVAGWSGLVALGRTARRNNSN
jgi:hypothetical protein